MAIIINWSYNIRCATPIENYLKQIYVRTIDVFIESYAIYP